MFPGGKSRFNNTAPEFSVDLFLNDSEYSPQNGDEIRQIWSVLTLATIIKRSTLTEMKILL